MHEQFAAAQLQQLSQARTAFEQHYVGLLPILRTKEIDYQVWAGGERDLTVVFGLLGRQVGLPLRPDGTVECRAGVALAPQDLVLEVMTRALGAKPPRQWRLVKWLLVLLATIGFFLYFYFVDGVSR